MLGVGSCPWCGHGEAHGVATEELYCGKLDVMVQKSEQGL